jgi:hypothetical protein
MAALLASIACSELQTPTNPSRVLSASRSPVSAPDDGFARHATEPSRQAVSWACVSTQLGCPIGAAPATVDPAAVVPGVPFNLSFAVTAATVTLTWSMASVGDPATSFIIEAGSVPGASNLAAFNSGTTATTATVTSVPAGTYFVRVRANNASGASGPSNEVMIVVGGTPGPGPGPGPCAPPAAPQGLTASASGTAFALQWNGVAGALGYVIEAGSTSGAANLAAIDTGTSATSFGGTAPAGTYYVRVRVRTTCGTSGASNEVILTLGGAAPPPVPPPTPPPTPPPGPSAGVSGQWIGLSPDGVSFSGGDCLLGVDVLLDLAQSGSTLSGRATSRVRQIGPGGCSIHVGDTIDFPLAGAVSGSAIAFRLEFTGDDPFFLDFTGTVSGNRMSGTLLVLDYPNDPTPTPGTWAVVRR